MTLIQDLPHVTGSSGRCGHEPIVTLIQDLLHVTGSPGCCLSHFCCYMQCSALRSLVCLE